MASLLAACSSPAKDEPNAAELHGPTGCVRSQWLGDLRYGGSWLDVQACVGNECTELERVDVVEGTSCTVAATTPPPPSVTERPEGMLLEDLARHVTSNGGDIEFSICALRTPRSGGDGGLGEVNLGVVVNFRNVPEQGMAPSNASLTVQGSTGEALLASEVGIDPPEDDSGCVAFAVDLEGSPLDMRTVL